MSDQVECGCGELHRVECPVAAATQPHAMINDAGEIFYPDGPDDARWFAAEHGARPLH